MRLHQSDLRVNLAESCGNDVEDAEQFFKDRDKFQEARDKIWQKHRVDLRRFNTEEIPEGNPEEENHHNSKLFMAVHEYIKLTKRFH